MDYSVITIYCCIISFLSQSFSKVHAGRWLYVSTGVCGVCVGGWGGMEEEDGDNEASPQNACRWRMRGQDTTNSDPFLTRRKALEMRVNQSCFSVASNL